MEYVGMDSFYKAWKERYFNRFVQDVFREQTDADELTNDILKKLDKMTDSNLTLYLLIKYGISFAMQVKQDYLNKVLNIKT